MSNFKEVRDVAAKLKDMSAANAEIEFRNIGSVFTWYLHRTRPMLSGSGRAVVLRHESLANLDWPCQHTEYKHTCINIVNWNEEPFLYIFDQSMNSNEISIPLSEHIQLRSEQQPVAHLCQFASANGRKMPMQDIAILSEYPALAANFPCHWFLDQRLTDPYLTSSKTLISIILGIILTKCFAPIFLIP